LGEGGCASPLPDIDPAVTDRAVPLSVPSLTIPIDHEGPYAVDAGTATLPNGVLSETAVTLTDDTRVDVLIPAGIRLEVIGEDGNPMSNKYDHGWRAGLETVRVRLVFDVDSFDPGAELVLTDLLVR
jgi:hypothetical protein